jgi:hypothetical protein
MRPTAPFTDGRIHVTLCHGPFDLRLLPAEDRAIWEALVCVWVEAPSADLFERGIRLLLADASDSILAMAEDLASRLALELAPQEEDALEEELLPWRPESARSRLEALGYQRLHRPRRHTSGGFTSPLAASPGRKLG